MLLPVAADAYVAASCPTQNTYIFIRLRLRPRPPLVTLPAPLYALSQMMASLDNLGVAVVVAPLVVAPLVVAPLVVVPLVVASLVVAPLVVASLVVVPLVVIVAFGFSAGGVD